MQHCTLDIRLQGKVFLCYGNRKMFLSNLTPKREICTSIFLIFLKNTSLKSLMRTFGRFSTINHVVKLKSFFSFRLDSLNINYNFSRFSAHAPCFLQLVNILTNYFSLHCQLLGAPRIYVEDHTPHWFREVDFTPSCCIGQSSALCLEVPQKEQLPKFHGDFVFQKALTCLIKSCLRSSLLFSMVIFLGKQLMKNFIGWSILRE